MRMKSVNILNSQIRGRFYVGGGTGNVLINSRISSVNQQQIGLIENSELTAIDIIGTISIVTGSPIYLFQFVSSSSVLICFNVTGLNLFAGVQPVLTGGAVGSVTRLPNL